MKDGQTVTLRYKKVDGYLRVQGRTITWMPTSWIDTASVKALPDEGEITLTLPPPAPKPRMPRIGALGMIDPSAGGGRRRVVVYARDEAHGHFFVTAIDDGPPLRGHAPDGVAEDVLVGGSWRVCVVGNGWGERWMMDAWYAESDR